MAAWANLLLAVGLSRSDLAPQLQTGDRFLKNLRDQFRHRAPDLQIASFWEQKAMPGLGVSSPSKLS